MKKTIKTLALLLIAAIPVFIFISCSDDDDDSNAESALIGTWVEDTSDVYEVRHVQFNSDHTGYQWATDKGVIDYYGKESFTWSATSKVITMTMYGQTQKINYTLSGDKFTVYDDSESITYVRE